MRIAVVGPTHPIKGGISQHTTVLARRLAAAGHEVRLLSWRKQYPQMLYPGQQTVDEPEFPPFEPTLRSLAWNRPDTWVRAARGLADADLVVFAQVTPVQVPPYLVMLRILRRLQVRSVVICHNVLPHEPSPVDRPLVQQLLRAADRVIVHTPEEAAVAARLTDRPVAVVPMPPHMPMGFVRGRPLPGEHRRLLFFGIVRPYKGLDVLLRALATGPGDVRLRVAGEFWGGVDATVRLCAELGITERVELRAGYVPASDVPKLFADVDALVLPYRSATGSQGVSTAFEFGVPVIATRTGTFADSIREGVDGVLADPDDVAALAAALGQFYQPGEPERLRRSVQPIDSDRAWAPYLAEVIAVGPVSTAGAARAPQLAYSELQGKMLDEDHRRTKARKIVSVLHHFLGRADLAGLTAVDIGCSAGFIADELAADGARTIGADIDVPGLTKAQSRFGGHVEFVCGSGDALPFDDNSVDVVVFNHIYEHVVDPDAVLAEIRRVLKPTGVAYLGLANKYQLMEPHYRLPLLSWLPQRVADRYVRQFSDADAYYEKHRSRPGLKQLLSGFHVWDYTIPVIRSPQLFGSEDVVRPAARRIPVSALRAARPLIPTYIWLATKGLVLPAGPPVEGLTHLDLSGPAAAAAQTAAPPGGRLLYLEKRAAEEALWARVALDRRRGRRPLPTAVPPTDVLGTVSEYERAIRECRSLGLPLHHDRPKNWDALGAVSTLLHHLGDDPKVLDAGAARYSSVLPWLRMYGIRNLVGNNLEFDRVTSHGSVRFEPGDITATPYGDGSFDAITCMSVIEHGVPLDAFFAESARILRRGGLLIVSTDYDQSPPDTAGLTAYGAPVRIFGPDAIEDLVAMASAQGLYLVGDLRLEHAQRPVHWARLGLDYTFIRLTFRRG